jgi:regulator of cell morphogenesis and NO signaling
MTRDVGTEGDEDMTEPLDPNRTLAQLVTDRPQLSRALEARGLDYCCQGERTLAAACGEAGLDVTTVAVELDTIGGSASPGEWATMAPDVLVDHLESTHHRYLHRELPRLAALVAKVEGVHASRHPELVDVGQCFAALRADLEPHLAKEERVLFPAIRRLVASDTLPEFPFGSLQRPISVMLAEHDQAGGLLARLRDLTGGYAVPDDACASYRACYEGLAELEADTHLHVHKENHLLFPAVVALEARRAGTRS